MSVEVKFMIAKWALLALTFLYLLQAYYIGCLILRAKKAAEAVTAAHLTSAEMHLAEAMLEQNKVTLSTQRDVLEAMQLLAARHGDLTKQVQAMVQTYRI